ncbi:MAG: agarase [Bacteroidota bacterium]
MKSIFKLFNIIIMAWCVSACQETKESGTAGDPFWDDLRQVQVLDFESDTIPEAVRAFNADIELTSGSGVTSGTKGLAVSLKWDENNTGFSYEPKTPIDVKDFKNLTLVFDATNTGEHSLHLMANVASSNGSNNYSSVALPMGKTKTVYLQLENLPLKKGTSDMRDYPDPWGTNSLKMLVRGLLYDLEYPDISKIALYSSKMIKDKSVVIDNVRLVEAPDRPEDYLVGIIDKYGQSAHVDYAGKIKSDEQLKSLAEEELARLEQEGTMPGRSKFGGWADGPKYEGTGYFTTKKIGNKWAMIDPEGHIFFSSGIANVRMANTTTFTGRDFKNDTVRWRDPEDVTPEDSRGIVDLPEAVTSTSFVSEPWRYEMFQELPSYEDPLANNFSYRREQHIGPFAHGETFSFYQANLERRYGEPTPDAHREKWVDVTLDRFLNWGFTSFGNWAGYEFYHENRMPYFANGWIIGEFQTVKSGMDYWGPLPDVFDPEFVRRAKVTVGVVAEEVKNNPWCVGVFIDNEKSWGRAGSVPDLYGIVFDALSKNAEKSFIKREFSKQLKNKYNTIAELNSAWGKDLSNWAEFDQGVSYKGDGTFSDEMVADLSNCMFSYADRYFQVVHDALEEVMPNHMYMGCRFATWGLTPEVRAAAKKYVDVFSINYYEEGIGDKYWTFLEDMDAPVVIGEWHVGTTATGVYHPGIVHAATREDRAQMYKDYLQSVIDNPYMVGAHWFQYIDSPTTGRAHDGENYNVGFVSTTDVPYPEMVEAVKEMHSDLYEDRYGNANEKSMASN